MRYLLLIFYVIFFPKIAIAAYDMKEYFPLEGSWTYMLIEDNKSSEEKVESYAKEVIGDIETKKFIYSEDRYECWFIDTDGVKQMKEFDKDEYLIYKPPILVFPAIEVGIAKEFLTNYDSHRSDGSKTGISAMVKDNIRLDSVEDVKTPAGKFLNCLKFVLSSRVEGSDGYEQDDCVVWLAPNTGIVKNTCIHTDGADDGGGEISTETRVLISATIEGKKIGGR